jgi:menaquinone-dependent protoporphyrinogen IX oxidase
MIRYLIVADHFYSGLVAIILVHNHQHPITMKGVIVYKGKYGATRQYAHWLSEALHLPAYEAGDKAIGDVKQYDFIVAGGSVYVGKWLLKEWIARYQPIIQRKKIFAFIVCATPQSAKEKLHKIAADNIPTLLPGSQVHFLPGKVIHKELSWLDRFALKMGAAFAKPEDKKNMRAEFNHVKREHLQQLIAEVKNLQGRETRLTESVPG